jgi:hypothetical protein
MLATILLFSSFVLDGFARFGVEATDEERDDYLHLWSWAGQVIGVDPALMPLNAERVASLQELIEITQGPPDEDSRALTRAFLDAPLAEAAPDERARMARRVAASHGILRGILGDARADALGIERNRYRHVVPAVARALRLGGALRRAPGLDVVAAKMGRRYWDGLMRFALADGPPTFAPPERLYG